MMLHFVGKPLFSNVSKNDVMITSFTAMNI